MTPLKKCNTNWHLNCVTLLQMGLNGNKPFEEKPDWKAKLSESLPFLKKLFQKNAVNPPSREKKEGTFTNIVKTELLKRASDLKSKLGSKSGLGNKQINQKNSDSTFPHTSPKSSLLQLGDKMKDAVTSAFTRRSLKNDPYSDGAISAMPLSPPKLSFNVDTLSFILTVFAILLLTFLAADLISIFIEKFIPEPQIASLRSRSHSIDPSLKLKSLSDYQVIISRNLFNNRGLIPGDQLPGSPSDLNNIPIKTTLPFNLIGTLVLKNELRSIATLEDKNDSQVYPVRIDDEIPGKVKILSIEPSKVVFINKASGRREFVDLPDNGSGGITLSGPKVSITGGKNSGIEQLTPGAYNVSRTEIDKALSNMQKVLTDARAIPHVENGIPAGFKLIQIVPDSIYSKLGLQDDDILCGVDGEPINDAGKAMELVASLKTRTALDLCVKRKGKTNNFNYNIK